MLESTTDSLFVVIFITSRDDPTAMRSTGMHSSDAKEEGQLSIDLGSALGLAAAIAVSTKIH